MSNRPVPTEEELPCVLSAQNIADHLQIARTTVYALFDLSPEVGGIPSYPVGTGKKASKRADKHDFLWWKQLQKKRKLEKFGLSEEVRHLLERWLVN